MNIFSQQNFEGVQVIKMWTGKSNGLLQNKNLLKMKFRNWTNKVNTATGTNRDIDALPIQAQEKWCRNAFGKYELLRAWKRKNVGEHNLKKGNSSAAKISIIIYEWRQVL